MAKGHWYEQRQDGEILTCKQLRIAAILNGERLVNSRRYINKLRAAGTVIWLGRDQYRLNVTGGYK
jgi:hypothetical protein